ncbi:MAG: SGNH/GDSL hydrolase family protein [Bdellovibrionales bacterium]|nr:SGNH/GDSL hydrolase family protein [Bdellovibrionales bacterium]
MKKETLLKLSLVVLGLGFGLVISEIALGYLFKAPRGTSFNSLEDVRRAMLEPSSVDSEKNESQPSLNALVQPHPDDRLIYDLKPHLDLTFMRVNVQTNSCGMRDPNRPLLKRSGTYRIGLLGDSFAFGWGVEWQQTFGHILEERLNARASNGRRFEVLNFGVPGYSTFQQVALYKERAGDFDLDEILVFMVDNDFGLPFYVRDIENPGGMLSAVSFVRLTEQALNPDLEKQKLELSGWGPNRALAELADLAAKSGTRLNVTINPNQRWKQTKQGLWVLRDRTDLRHIKLRRDFLEVVERNKIDPKELSLSFDPHPSPLKHRILGELLAPYFFDVL